MDDMLVGAGSGIVSSALDFIGRRNANKQNRRMFKEQMAFNKETRDNAVQIRRADLEAARINPILAAGQAASGSAPAAPTMEPEITGAGVNSALSYGLKSKMVKGQVEQMQHQVELLKNQALNSAESIRTQKSQQSLNAAQAASALELANNYRVDNLIKAQLFNTRKYDEAIAKDMYTTYSANDRQRWVRPRVEEVKRTFGWHSLNPMNWFTKGAK